MQSERKGQGTVKLAKRDLLVTAVSMTAVAVASRVYAQGADEPSGDGADCYYDPLPTPEAATTSVPATPTPDGLIVSGKGNDTPTVVLTEGLWIANIRATGNRGRLFGGTEVRYRGC